ncbi:phospholipase A1-II 5 [Cocos nucifera]|nr:phospholipase A1-II 5 [Cocos nucifera]
MAKDGAATPSWQVLLGSNHWAGLLDLSLRRLFLQCGDLCQVTYDSFNSDKLSNDEAWSKDSNWIGYMAVSSDDAALKNGRREIYVAWRGTIRPLEWLDVAQPELVLIDSILSSTQRCWANDDEVPKVMKGWYIIYTSSDPQSPFNKDSARDQLLPQIKQLVERYKNESLSIICVGHSLGASLAILSAFDIVENGVSKIGEDSYVQVCAMVFGSPQIGNKAFKDRLEQLPNLRVLHTKNKIDLIPQYPSGLLGYVFTGVELVVDTRKSPYLKDSMETGNWHNLQGILQAVAGWNGEDGEFEFKVKRCMALVNKSCDHLKEPPHSHPFLLVQSPD